MCLITNCVFAISIHSDNQCFCQFSFTVSWNNISNNILFNIYTFSYQCFCWFSCSACFFFFSLLYHETKSIITSISAHIQISMFSISSHFLLVFLFAIKWNKNLANNCMSNIYAFKYQCFCYSSNFLHVFSLPYHETECLITTASAISIH